MELGLTIPLQKYLKMKPPPYGALENRHYCWDLHLIRLHGRGCLLAVHAASRYTFTLFAPTFAGWANLQGSFLYGLQESLCSAGFGKMQVEAYLARAGLPVLTRTHGRREVAFLNRAWEDVAALDYAADETCLCQPLLDAAVNTLARRCAGNGGVKSAAVRLARLLR